MKDQVLSAIYNYDRAWPGCHQARAGLVGTNMQYASGPRSSSQHHPCSTDKSAECMHRYSRVVQQPSFVMECQYTTLFFVAVGQYNYVLRRTLYNMNQVTVL